MHVKGIVLATEPVPKSYALYDDPLYLIFPERQNDSDGQQVNTCKRLNKSMVRGNLGVRRGDEIVLDPHCGGGCMNLCVLRSFEMYT